MPNHKIWLINGFNKSKTSGISSRAKFDDLSAIPCHERFKGIILLDFFIYNEVFCWLLFVIFVFVLFCFVFLFVLGFNFPLVLYEFLNTKEIWYDCKFDNYPIETKLEIVEAFIQKAAFTIHILNLAIFFSYPRFNAQPLDCTRLQKK